MLFVASFSPCGPVFLVFALKAPCFHCFSYHCVMEVTEYDCIVCVHCFVYGGRLVSYLMLVG
jgi:hypothetical protein